LVARYTYMLGPESLGINGQIIEGPV